MIVVCGPGHRSHHPTQKPTPYNRFHSQSTKTDQTGRFTITGLAPGKYRVLARSQASAESGSLKSAPQNLTLAEHDHQTVELTMPKPQGHWGSRVSGVFRDSLDKIKGELQDNGTPILYES